VTGNDVKWPHVTGSGPEVMSFDRKSPGSGCRRPVRQVLGTFELLQSCNLQEVAVKWLVMSRDFTWREGTSFERKSPGNGYRRPVSQVLGTFELLLGSNSQEVAVTWQEMMLRSLTRPEVTRMWRDLTRSHRGVAVEGL